MDHFPTWMQQIAVPPSDPGNPIYWIIAVYLLGLYADLTAGRLFGKFTENLHPVIANIGRFVRGVLCWFGIGYLHAILAEMFPVFKTSAFWCNFPTLLGLALVWKCPGLMEAMGILAFAHCNKKKKGGR